VSRSAVWMVLDEYGHDGNVPLSGALEGQTPVIGDIERTYYSKAQSFCIVAPSPHNVLHIQTLMPSTALTFVCSTQRILPQQHPSESREASGRLRDPAEIWRLAKPQQFRAPNF